MKNTYFERSLPLNYEVLPKGVIQCLLELRVVGNSILMPNKSINRETYRRVKDCLVTCGGEYKLGFEKWEFKDADNIKEAIKSDIQKLKQLEK